MITDKDIMDCKAGLDDTLTIVQLFNEPETVWSSAISSDERRRDCFKWCLDNLGKEDELWAKDGVTVFSWRILFSEKEDAVAFKLTFGL